MSCIGMKSTVMVKKELDDDLVKIEEQGEPEMVVIENVAEYDDVHQEIICTENIPHILQNFSKANSNVKIIQLEDGQYSYIIENSDDVDTGAQYELANDEHYVIEEYQDDYEQPAAEPTEYETLYIRSVDSPQQEIYTISEEVENEVEDEGQGMEMDEDSDTVLEKEEPFDMNGSSNQFANETLDNDFEEFLKTKPQPRKQSARTELRRGRIKQRDPLRVGELAATDEEEGIDDETPEKDTEPKEEQQSDLQFVYECALCTKSFSTASGVKRHISVIHSKLAVEKPSDPDVLSFSLCFCCGEPTDSAHTIGDFNCEECGKLFIYENSLERHKSIEHPVGEKYECYECKKVFLTKELIIEHAKVHSIKSVKCGDCGREFSRKYHLERHIGQTGCMGVPKQVYECRVCSKNFTRKDNLADHLKAHAGIMIKRKQQITCEFCMKEFNGVALLQIHIRTHTGERPYACDICEKKFPSGGAMTKHRRKHTGEKPYMCPQCGTRFSAKETLNRHWRIHTGDKPHKCKFCGKGFIQPSQLRAHIFHHTGENAFTCPHCNRAFNRKLRLTTHIKYMHEGAKPLSCPEAGCGKTFFRKEDIHRHLITHSGEKPYKCDVCDKSFAIKSSLRVHRNIHRKEAPVSCEVCNNAFIRKDCLMRHMRARHRDVLEDIVANAEKKRLQTQLFQAVANAANKESLKDSIVWNELTLTESIKELLGLLVDEEYLKELGHPEAPVDRVLEAVIRRCGHSPAKESEFDYIGKIRENAKLLFTVVIDDNSVKELLRNHTVDEVIMHVLKLARKQANGTLSEDSGEEIEIKFDNFADEDDVDNPEPVVDDTDEGSNQMNSIEYLADETSIPTDEDQTMHNSEDD